MTGMTPYVVTLAVGILVGGIYGLLAVRSPAPPVIALVGLLGILAGEQAVAFAKRHLAGLPLSSVWIREHCAPHMFGALPRQPNPAPQSGDRINIAKGGGSNENA